MGRINKILLALALGALLAASSFLFWISGKYVVPIMMYHHVALTEKKPNWVSPENFEKQMAYLFRHNYNVISLSDLTDAIKEKKSLPHHTVVITFDDGYEDNYTQGFSILKKFHLPATMFLISSTINTEGYLKISQLKEMIKDNITFGCHSKTHPYLPDLSPEDQEKEIAESKVALSRMLDTPIDLFAYPSGGFTEETKELLKKYGFKAACTTNRGRVRDNTDLYELKRIRFGNTDTNGWQMWLKLSGYYNLFRKTKNSY